MRIFFNKYSVRVTSLVLLLSTIPVLLLGTAAYWKSSQTVQEQVVQSNMQVLLQTHIRIEKELKLIDQMSNNLVVSDWVNGMLRQRIDERDYSIVNQVQQSLNMFRSYELGVRDAYLYSLQNDWLIGASTFYWEGSARLDASELSNYAASPYSSFWVVDWEENDADGGRRDSVIKLVKKLLLYASNPLGLMIVSVSVPDLQTLLADNRLAGTTFILDEHYRLVASNGGGSEETGAVTGQLASMLDGAEEAEGSYTLSTDRERFAVIYRKASYNNWIYVSMVPIREITQKSRDIGWYTFYTCAALVLLTAFLSLLGSNRLYRPVRKLYDVVQRQMDKTEDNASGRDELEVIGERFHSIWHLRNELSEKLERQRPQLKEFYLLKLFSGDGGEAASKLSELGFGLEATAYHALVLQIDTLADTRFEERDRDLLLFAINNMVGELIDGPHRLDPVVIQQSQVTIIGSPGHSPAQWKKEASRWAKLVQNKVDEFWGLSVSLGISSPFHRLQDAGKAYTEALEALKYRLRLGNEAILFYSEVVPSESPAAEYPTRLLDELVDAIKLADRQSAFDKLHAFIAQVVSDEVNQQVYRLSFVRLLAELLNVAQETVSGLQHLEGDRLLLFEQLFELQSVQEIEEWFRDRLIEPMILMLEQKRKARFQKISEEIKRMVEEGYDSGLTLELCAERLNYHPVYVSRIFRKETGMSFSDYLSGYRHEEAKRLLAQTQLSVAEIAAKVGYNNGPNLSRHFKKVEGMTPGHYRELAQARDPLREEPQKSSNERRSDDNAGNKV